MTLSGITVHIGLNDKNKVKVKVKRHSSS